MKDGTGSSPGAGAPPRRAALICAGRRRPHRTAPATAPTRPGRAPLSDPPFPLSTFPGLPAGRAGRWEASGQGDGKGREDARGAPEDGASSASGALKSARREPDAAPALPKGWFFPCEMPRLEVKSPLIP